MRKRKAFLALDFGAESGRAVAGLFDGEQLALEKVHHFANGPVNLLGSLHWDVLRLFVQAKAGIAKAWEKYENSLLTLGIDTWGVDYGLLDDRGKLLGNPYHYRDKRTDGMEEEAFRRMSRDAIYEATGIQFMFFNTLFQLLSQVVSQSPLLSVADRLLFTPDLLNYWLTGRKVNERTISSTGQVFDPNTRDWAFPMLEKMEIPTRVFGEIVSPGTVLGEVLPELRQEMGVGPIVVVAPGCHDTASAVAGVPAREDHYAYLSSGTWSLMGVESAKPISTEKGLEYGFTNEAGVCDTIRVLKNISGLWLVQECRRTWAQQGERLSYDDLILLAEEAEPFTAVIDPDYSGFARPGDMPARIAEHSKRLGQKPPQKKGSIIRTVLESLALRYRSVFGKLEDLVGHRLEVLHIVGGGSRNRLLNQFTANAICRPVVAGPVEATSVGNVLMQMLATAHIASLQEGRDLVRRSFQTETYEPADTEIWQEAYQKYLHVEGEQ